MEMSVVAEHIESCCSSREGKKRELTSIGDTNVKKQVKSSIDTHLATDLELETEKKLGRRISNRRYYQKKVHEREAIAANKNAEVAMVHRDLLSMPHTIVKGKSLDTCNNQTHMHDPMCRVSSREGCLQSAPNSKDFTHKESNVYVNVTSPSANGLLVRRKEMSLSSLVVNTPQVAIQAGLTGRRTITTARRRDSALHGLDPVIAEPTKKEINHVEDSGGNSGSSGTLSMITQNRRQNSSAAQPSNHAPNKNTENGSESLKNNSELWPLNCLIAAANSTKHLESTPQCSILKDGQTNGPDSEVLMHKIKARVHPHESEVDDEKDDNIPLSLLKIRTRRLHGRKKRDLGASTHVHIEAAGGTRGSRNCPIWLSLVPSMDWNGNAAVPLTPSCYLRIKDGNLTVSFIEKYLVYKFNLPSEAEVEITCRGQVVSSTLTLQNLTDLWLQSEPSCPVHATLGTSAKDFVMVLNYSCKNPAS